MDLEPWRVTIEIQVIDGVDVRTEEGFEYKLADVLFIVKMLTEVSKIEKLDGRIVLSDLSEQTCHRHSSRLAQVITHVRKF